MNCKQVEKLLPLFAGDDLKESRARSLAAHLESCVKCARIAVEYVETRQMLREFAPPAISEDVYAEISRNVWRTIEADATDRSHWKIFAGWLHPRRTWAMAAAVLIAISIFMVYFVARESVRPPQIANRHDPAINASPEPLQSPELTSKESPVRSADSNEGSVGRRSASGLSTHRRTHRNLAIDRASSTVAFSSPSPATGSAEKANTESQSDAGSDRDSAKILRMEFQTRNPNIRIIWFSHPEPKHGSSNSKGI
jgi:hypothetical protein